MRPVTSSPIARALALTAVSAALGAGVVACGDPPPPPQFRVSFTALADAAPLAGVEIDIAARPLGLTGPGGVLRANLRGREGAVVGYSVKCPAGYRNPEDPPPLTLRQFRRRHWTLLRDTLARLLAIGAGSVATDRWFDAEAEADLRLEQAAAADSLALDC